MTNHSLEGKLFKFNIYAYPEGYDCLTQKCSECTGGDHCEICIKRTSSWANNLDLALCPTLFLKCWASVDGTEQSKGAYDWSKKK
jgi:hypothetical protein